MNYNNAIFDIENIHEAYKSTDARLREDIELFVNTSAQPMPRSYLINKEAKRLRDALSDLPDVMRAIANRLNRISEQPDTAERLLALANAIENDEQADYGMSELANISAKLSENTPLRLMSLLPDFRANIRIAIKSYQRMVYLEQLPDDGSVKPATRI